MTAKIQVRRDTAANWSNAANNPTLAQGEFGLETDTNRIKIGNGSSAWNALPYLEAGLPFISSGASADLNTLTVQGRYRFSNGSGCTSRPTTTHATDDLQSQYTGTLDASDGGVCLTVVRFDNFISGTAANSFIVQTLVTDGNSTSDPVIPPKAWIRRYDGDAAAQNWGKWYPLLPHIAGATANNQITFGDGTDVRARRVVAGCLEVYGRSSNAAGGNGSGNTQGIYLWGDRGQPDRWYYIGKNNIAADQASFVVYGGNIGGGPSAHNIIRHSHVDGLEIGENNLATSSTNSGAGKPNTFTTYGNTLLAQNTSVASSVQIGNVNKASNLTLFGNLIMDGSGTVIDMNGRRVTELGTSTASTDAISWGELVSRVAFVGPITADGSYTASNNTTWTVTNFAATPALITPSAGMWDGLVLGINSSGNADKNRTRTQNNVAAFSPLAGAYDWLLLFAVRRS